MEQPVDKPPARDTKLKAVYWLAAAAMTFATVTAAIERVDWLAIVGRGSLVAALVVMATARPEETRAKKVLIYSLVAISLGLFLARLMRA